MKNLLVVMNLVIVEREKRNYSYDRKEIYIENY